MSKISTKFIVVGIIVALFLVLSIKKKKVGNIAPENLKCEFLTNPKVIDSQSPRLSWINIPLNNTQNDKQTAYQIKVASCIEYLENDSADVWDSNKVKSDKSFLVSYGGGELESMKTYYWKVRTWDKTGNPSSWSEPASWNMGILKPELWQAKWIGAPWQDDNHLTMGSNEMPPAAPLFRKKFNINNDVKDVKVYVTGLGYFEFYLNGKKVGDDVLVPNQTNYDKRDNLEKYGIPVEDKFKEIGRAHV